jgi:hypothetical protein
MKTLNPWPLLLIVLIAVTLASVACANFEAKTPQNFVHLEDDRSQYDYRATSADGIVLAVREIENEPQGELEFWSDAIENSLSNQAGYSLLNKEGVKTAQGHPGIRLQLGLDNSGKPHEYTVAVFVTDDHVFLVEVGGEKSLLEQNAATIDGWLSAFEIQ